MLQSMQVKRPRARSIMAPRIATVFMRYPCCIANRHDAGFPFLTGPLPHFFELIYLHPSRSQALPHRKLWSQQPLSVIPAFECWLLSSTAGASNAAYERNKALAVPTWSFCEILGSVGKQGRDRKRRLDKLSAHWTEGIAAQCHALAAKRRALTFSRDCF